MEFGQRSSLSVIDRELFRYATTHQVYLKYLIEGTTFLHKLHGVGWPTVTLNAKSPQGNRYELVVAAKTEDGTLEPRLYLRLWHQLGPAPRQIPAILAALQEPGVQVLHLFLGFAGVEYAFLDSFWSENGPHTVPCMATPQVIAELQAIELNAGKEYKQPLAKYRLLLKQQLERIEGFYASSDAHKLGRRRLFYYSLYHAVRMTQPYQEGRLRLLQSPMAAAGYVVLRDTQSEVTALVGKHSVRLVQEFFRGQLVVRATLTDVPEAARESVRSALQERLLALPVAQAYHWVRTKPRTNDSVLLAALQPMEPIAESELPMIAQNLLQEGKRLLLMAAKG